LQCNSNLLAGQKMTVDRTQFLREELGKYHSMSQVLAENGPFDDPSCCYHLGLGFAGGGMLRQACQQFERIKALVPGDVAARLTLGDLFNSAVVPARALQIAAEIRADPDLQPLGLTNDVEAELLEARAWFVLTNRPRAQAIVYGLLATHPGDAFVLERAVATFTAYQSYSDALRLTDRQLQLAPNDAAVLANKGNLCILTGDFSNAIPPLTLSLSLTNTHMARFNRARAYLRTGRLDAAAADYQELLQAFPNALRAYLGLGEIALHKKDTNAAIRYCEQYLSKAEADTDETRLVAARLKSLQQSRP